MSDSLINFDNNVIVYQPLDPDEWVRSSEWLTIPELTASTEQVCYLLAGVWDRDDNYAAFAFAGAYTVDWGDGTIENIATGVKAQHQYTFSSCTNLTSYGYKQCLIKVTPQAGNNLTRIDLQRFHTSYQTGRKTIFLDMVLSLQNVLGNNNLNCVIGGNGAIALHTNCERVWIKNIGALTTTDFLFYNFKKLKNIPVFNTASSTSFIQTFYNCSELIYPPLLNTALSTACNGMFSYCTSLKVCPSYIFNTSFNASGMFSYCTSLKDMPNIDFSKATNLYQTFIGCTLIEKIPYFNSAICTNLSYFLNGASNITSVEELNFTGCTTISTVCYLASNLERFSGINMGNITDTSIAFTGCQLKSLTCGGLKITFTVLNNNLSASAINALFTSLGTPTGAATVTVKGNWGASTCDTTIASNKGFTVIIA